MPESDSLTGGPGLLIDQWLIVGLVNSSIATRNLPDVTRVGDYVFENIGGESGRRRPIVSEVRRSRRPHTLSIEERGQRLERVRAGAVFGIDALDCRCRAWVRFDPDFGDF